MTPDSFISSQRSLPSRVRSPTPANTETPPCCSATLWISSWISTVLPSPAPPKRPILPPRTNGAIRSMTLIPVSKISAFGERSRNAGGSRWIGQRSAPSARSPWSTGSPSTFQRRPSVTLPTGTLMGAPVSTTSTPRGRPSVESIATARTRSSPRCCWTSAISSRARRAVASGNGDAKGGVDLGQRAGEDGVDDDALDLDHLADVLSLAIGLLKRGLHEEMPRLARTPAGKRPESTEARSRTHVPRQGAAVLHERGHTGLVVVRSAVRGDERRDHAHQTTRWAKRYGRWLSAAPNTPTPEPCGGCPPSWMRRSMRSSLKSLSPAVATSAEAGGVTITRCLGSVPSTVVTPATAATRAATRARVSGRARMRRRVEIETAWCELLGWPGAEGDDGPSSGLLELGAGRAVTEVRRKQRVFELRQLAVHAQRRPGAGAFTVRGPRLKRHHHS